MKCSKCGKEMIEINAGYYECANCNTSSITINDRPIYIKQEPRIDENGIWVPCFEYVSEGCASNYRLIISKEMFVEAYNKWIKGE